MVEAIRLRLRRPGGRLRLRDRARRRRPAVRHQERLRPGRRPGRRLHLRLVRPALHPAADPDAILRVHDGEIVILPGRPRRAALGSPTAALDRPRGRDVTETHGRGQKGGYAALHAQGDPRAAAGRRASCCTCWTPPPTWRRMVERHARAPATSTWSAAAPATTPACWARSIWPSSPGGRRSRSSRRSSSPSTRPPRPRGCRRSSSARAARPRTCSTRSRRRERQGHGAASGWST